MTRHATSKHHILFQDITCLSLRDGVNTEYVQILMCLPEIIHFLCSHAQGCTLFSPNPSMTSSAEINAPCKMDTADTF